MATKRNTEKKASKIAKTPRGINHTCRQVDQIRKLNLLLLGNGNPEDGYIFKVISMAESQVAMKNDISDIKAGLTGINENYNVLFGEIARVGKDLSNYIESKNGEEAGAAKEKEKKEKDDNRAVIAKNLELTKSRDTWYKVLTIIGIAIAIYFGIKSSNQGDKIIKTTDITKEKVEKQEIPFVMNSRGEFVALPDSTIIKWFGNDTLRYTIIRDKQ